jgi:hypothetical protein
VAKSQAVEAMKPPSADDNEEHPRVPKPAQAQLPGFGNTIKMRVKFVKFTSRSAAAIAAVRIW